MPLITEYTFQLGDTGIVLNDDAASIPFVDIDRVTGLDSPQFRETMRDHEGVDGGFIDAEFETGREIFLEGTAYCQAGLEEVYMDQLKFNYAPVRTSIPFYLKAPSVDERVIFVKSRGVSYDWSTLRRIGMTRIQFKMFAEDPRLYDNFLQQYVIPFGGEIGTGLGFSFGFPFGFGATVLPNGLTVTNVGNRPTPAILTIQGPVVNPQIINDTLSRRLGFIITLGALDTLVIDLGNRTVNLNGNVNRRNTMSTAEWFLISPGDSFIRFGGGSGTGTMTVTFRNAWR
jgi:hypothetical protein